MSVSKKGFEERAATVFENKVAKLFDNVKFNLLKVESILNLLAFTVFSPNASEND